MAKKSMIIRESNRKFPVQVRNRCSICGRPRGYMRRFGCPTFLRSVANYNLWGQVQTAQEPCFRRRLQE